MRQVIFKIIEMKLPAASSGVSDGSISWQATRYSNPSSASGVIKKYAEARFNAKWDRFFINGNKKNHYLINQNVTS